MELPTAFSGPFANEVDGSQVSESREIGFAMRELLVERVKRLVAAPRPAGRGRVRHLCGVRRGDFRGATACRAGSADVRPVPGLARAPSHALELLANRKGENLQQPVEKYPCGTTGATRSCARGRSIR